MTVVIMTMMSGIVNPTRTDARRRMIMSAALLIRERGVEATSFSDVIEHSGAPRGSIYHHFPGGKAQLVEEAVRAAADASAAALARSLEGEDPAEAIRLFAAGWRDVLRATDFRAGCPVVAAAVEGDRTPAARDAAAVAFTRWEHLLSAAFERGGVPAERARALATLVVAGVEGAVVLARAQHSTEPLERVADELVAIVRAAA